LNKQYINRLSRIAIIFLLSINLTNVLAAHKSTLQSISNILDSSAKETNVGIIVKSLNTGAVLYERNAKHFFMPASSLKILTAIAALDYLGPDYRFVTKIVANFQYINNGVLNSDVYLYFDGDPTLTKNDVEQLVAYMARLGIKKIQGNFYIDDYIYDQKRYADGWMWDELNLCYAAPAMGIILDKNCFSLELNPSSNGSIAEVIKKDSYPLFSAYSYVVAKKGNTSDCQLNFNVTENNEYYLNGCVNYQNTPINIQLAVKNPRFYAQNLVVLLLQKYSIDITGKIGFAAVRKTGYVLASHASEPLNQLVKKMMKHSDNLIADSLYKKIASHYFDGTGSWAKGANAIKQILHKDMQVDLSKAKIFDGSGLSRYDLISPEQMVKLLSFAYYASKINNDLLNSLPIGGIDGSLSLRMKKNGMTRRVRAKTGTMSGISSLAGYVDTVSHKKLVFVIMFNSFADSPRKYEAIEDRICEILASL
jgi:serine-type D-Ala-D-Ala carboxypeptidase/endopeptidase (penicillin-binding protein 4)